MAKVLFDCESLRLPEHVCEPDPRNESFVTWDETGRFRTLEVVDYHARVSRLKLNKNVPERVAIQFETVKNLYVYSWFVYRFFPVAEHQALACLELALRARYEPNKKRSSGLKVLFRRAVRQGDVTNEGFEKWREGTAKRARYRYEMRISDEMREKNLDTMVVDYANVEITDQDRDWDYIKILLDTLPYFRNQYAHGSASLHNQVLGTIQIVGEIINQIFRDAPPNIEK